MTLLITTPKQATLQDMERTWISYNKKYNEIYSQTRKCGIKESLKTIPVIDVLNKHNEYGTFCDNHQCLVKVEVIVYSDKDLSHGIRSEIHGQYSRMDVEIRFSGSKVILKKY